MKANIVHRPTNPNKYTIKTYGIIFTTSVGWHLHEQIALYTTLISMTCSPETVEKTKATASQKPRRHCVCIILSAIFVSVMLIVAIPTIILLETEAAGQHLPSRHLLTAIPSDSEDTLMFVHATEIKRPFLPSNYQLKLETQIYLYSALIVLSHQEVKMLGTEDVIENNGKWDASLIVADGAKCLLNGSISFRVT